MAYAAQALKNLITNQLEPSGVHSATVLDAIASVPREIFAPEHLKEAAYSDEELPLGHDRSVMEPRVFGKILQYLEVKPGETVLDLGCGTGYSSAVMAKMGAVVTAVESVGELAEQARQNFRELGVSAQIFGASLSGGYALKAPFDVIFINGAVEMIHDEITDQLAEGGRLATIEVSAAQLGGMGASGQVVCYHKLNGSLHRQILFDGAANSLPEFKKRQGFIF